MPGFVGPDACRDLRRAAGHGGGWLRVTDAGRDLEERPFDDRVFTRCLAEALAQIGLEAGALRLVRHQSGGFGLPAAEGPLAFAIDLNSDWRSDWGGLLLFAGARGPLSGWRPEPGALTVFDAAGGAALSLIAPEAVEPRLMLFGPLALT